MVVFHNLNLNEEEIEKMKDSVNRKITRKIQLRLRHEKEGDLVINQIFQHLTAQEMLSCCQVSKGWNKKIGHLGTFAKRIGIKGTAENFDLILNSERYYEKIELMVSNVKSEFQDAEKIMLKYSQNLKKFKFVKFGGFNSILNDSLNFSHHLKEVDLQCVCGSLSGKFLKYVKVVNFNFNLNF